MKKVLFTLTIVIAIFACAGFTFAGATPNQSNMEGVIDLPDGAPRPGIWNLAVSQSSYVTYVVGYLSLEMGVTSSSGKTANDESMQFVVYGCQIPGAPDDNNVYQKSRAETAKGGSGELTPTAAITWEPPTEADLYVIRGAGSVSTFALPTLSEL